MSWMICLHQKHDPSKPFLTILASESEIADQVPRLLKRTIFQRVDQIVFQPKLPRSNELHGKTMESQTDLFRNIVVPNQSVAVLP